MLRTLAVVLLSTSVALAATVKTSDFLESLRKNSDSTIPGAFIVELSSSPTKRAADVHADFLDELAKRAAGKFTTRKKYDSPLFNGVAVQLHNPEDLASLKSIPNIVAVNPIQVFRAPEPVAQHILSSPDDPNAIPFGQSTHYMTGVDHVHEQGIAGKGIKIGIIDTGIDYLHPSLGGAFGPGNKVAGGYDFVGDDYDGIEPPLPDDDPRDTCNGHGTHVAGIIGANPGNGYNISGVAYEATILAYCVFSCSGVTSDDIVADAMLRAYSDGADILNMSLGGTNGWASQTLSVIASRIADRGRVVSVAAGNEGRGGATLFSTPAAGESVISITAVENIRTLHPTLNSSVEHVPIPYDNVDYGSLSGQPLPVEEKPYTVYALSTDPAADDMACSMIGDFGLDLSQYAVIVRRSASTCDFLTQLFWLKYAKVELLIVYGPGKPFLISGFFSTVVLKNNEDGAFLVSEAAKSTITVTFPQGTSGIEFPNNDNGGLMSQFSTYGPSNELLFKPAIAAPGGNITSTWLTDAGSWAVLSGSSMSTPYIAGSAALLLQVKGKAVSKNVRSILQSTSKPIPAARDKDAPPQTLAQAGAGLVNVYNALNVETEISPAEILLNDTAHWKGLHTITIKNTGKKVQTYELSHQPANTLISLDSKGIHYLDDVNIKQIDAPAGVHLSKSSVDVLPGHSATVLATITLPKNVDAKLLPIVSGSIIATGSLGDIVKVSYMGVAGSLREAQSISTGNDELVEGGVPAVIPLDQDRLYPQRGPRNYTLDNLPAFAFMMAEPSRHVTIDLIDAASNITSTIPDPLDSLSPEKRNFNWSWWWPGLEREPIPTLGAIADWRDMKCAAPYVYTSGVPYIALEFPTQFANGTGVPFGLALS